ncbi:hypothetical protein [Streptomyces sp. NPDC005262]|uniref:hypothetical protein n=1 Tax=Streptomyces sp. NPDC005262 TaxID=3364710 RepID=UPI0036B97303
MKKKNGDDDRHHQLRHTLTAVTVSAQRCQRANGKPDMHGKQTAPDPDATGPHVQRQYESGGAR